MLKKDKLYFLALIFSFLSIGTAIILKACGIGWFLSSDNDFDVPTGLSYITDVFMLSIQFLLIVGCIIGFHPQKMFFKALPYLPLNAIVPFLPHDIYVPICMILMFVTCMSIKPRFSTLIMFVANIAVILIMQMALIWLKFDIIQVPMFPTFMQLIIVNIDQFIILTLLYYANRKWGEKYVSQLVFHWTKK